MILQERQIELQKVYRYKNYSDVMFFRPHLGIHSKRVALMAEYICDALIYQGVSIDKEYVIALAHMHDDEEIVTGDFVSQEKLSFSPKQQQTYKQDCENAIQILVENYPKDFMGYNYEKLLYDNNSGISLEFMIMDLADKLDAHGEVCHELCNGNKRFLREVYFEGYGEIDSYTSTYNRSREREIKLQNATGIKIPVLGERIQSLDVIGKIPISSRKELKNISTGYEIYDTWIRLQLDNFSDEELEKLYLRSNGNVS